MLVSQKVMVNSRRPGPTWLPGEIIQKLGLVTHLVDVFDDLPWKCQVDQLNERADIPTTTTSTNSPTPPSHAELHIPFKTSQPFH